MYNLQARGFGKGVKRFQALERRVASDTGVELRAEVEAVIPALRLRREKIRGNDRLLLFSPRDLIVNAPWYSRVHDTLIERLPP